MNVRAGNNAFVAVALGGECVCFFCVCRGYVIIFRYSFHLMLIFALSHHECAILAAWLAGWHGNADAKLLSD